MAYKAIEVTGLSKSYGETKAADNISFTVSKGQAIGLLGANGAGKTTTLECVLGTRTADSGEISILGLSPIRERKRLFEQVGVQFQHSGYQDNLKVNELCDVTQSLYINPADYSPLLEEFGLLDKKKEYIKNLSGGQKQRLFTVLALIPSPKVLFLDEVSAGLDSRARRSVWSSISKLKSEGLAIVLTSHFMDEIEFLCDEIIILKSGKIVFQGSTEDAVKESPFESFEDAYLWYTDEEDKYESI